MREVKTTVRAISAPIDDLTTFRPFPTQQMEHLDPFLFLNHHGPQDYRKNNRGLPFGPHPHRGFETLTFILTGDLVHWDSSGSKSIIKEGGIQWMTAGSGLIHSETSSEEFKKEGGKVEILQLWMNLPARLKMLAPSYQGFTKEEIPVVTMDNDLVKIQVISGELEGVIGPAESVTDLTMGILHFSAEAEITLTIPKSNEILLYTVDGRFKVNGQEAQTHDLVLFEQNGDQVTIKSATTGRMILGFGQPLNEPIVAYGPFVMNSEEEIKEAYQDYQSGKMGRWDQ